MSIPSTPPSKRQKRTHDSDDDSDKENDMMSANKSEEGEEKPAIAVNATATAGDGKILKKEDAVKTEELVVKKEEESAAATVPDSVPDSVPAPAAARAQTPRRNLANPAPAGVPVRVGTSSATGGGGKEPTVNPNMIMDVEKVAEDLEMAILNAQITEAAKECREALATAKTAAKRQDIRRWELYRVHRAGGRGLKGREARVVWGETMSWLQDGLEVGQIEDKYGWGLWN